MSNQEPSLNLDLGEGKTLNMHPGNATLYTFLGRTLVGEMEIDNSSVNHVFIKTGENEQGQSTGMYIFKEFDAAYGGISAHMTDHRYPMVLNQRTIPQCDLTVWQQRVDMAMAEFSGQIPDEL